MRPAVAGGRIDEPAVAGVTGERKEPEQIGEGHMRQSAVPFPDLFLEEVLSDVIYRYSA